MISINIYQPGKINADINFPDCWNDLSEAELHFIAKNLLEESDKSLIKAQVLKFIITARVQQSKLPLPSHFFSLFDPEELSIQLFSFLDFIFKNNDLTNLPTAVTYKFQRYYPQNFEEITCAEFEDCEIVAHQFSESSDPEELKHLAAILFRPSPSLGGVRGGRPYIKYHAADDTYQIYQAEKHKKAFSKLKPEHLYSILIWYAGCRAQLPKYFGELYRGGNNNGKPDPMVFTNTIHAGAGPKNGTRNQIRAMKLYEFLYDCNQEAIKARELKEEYDKIK